MRANKPDTSSDLTPVYIWPQLTGRKTPWTARGPLQVARCILLRLRPQQCTGNGVVIESYPTKMLGIAGNWLPLLDVYVVRAGRC